MHVGSSSNLHTTSFDAPVAMKAILMWSGCCYALADWLTCGALVRFPNLRIALSEGQVGWIPYLLQRIDIVWKEHRAHGELGANVPVPPSQLYFERVFGCVFNDATGLRHLDEVGEDNVTFEVDYPHGDSTWPDTKRLAEEQLAHLTPEQTYKVLRGNAIRMLGLDLDKVRP
jgi:predicted TIM-barrel fold metal-dependent hydrolase